MCLHDWIKFIALLTLFHLPVEPLKACDAHPGVDHERWMQWVNERNQKNEARQAAEATPLNEQKKKSPETSNRPRYERRTSAGDTPIIRVGR